MSIPTTATASYIACASQTIGEATIAQRGSGALAPFLMTPNDLGLSCQATIASRNIPL